VIQLPSPLAQAEPDLALPTRVVPPAPKAVRHESNFPLHGNLPIMANSATQAREDAPTVSSFHQSIVTADETPPTNRPAETLPAKRPVADILSAYGQELAAAVNTHKRYPRIALLRQLQGSVVLQLEFGVEGRLSGVRVLSSSGYEILDKQALEMVREATPLPQLPAALAGRSLTADIPVVFRISS
jgi:protein TonB